MSIFSRAAGARWIRSCAGVERGAATLSPSPQTGRFLLPKGNIPACADPGAALHKMRAGVICF